MRKSSSSGSQGEISSLLRAHSRGSFGRLLFESEHCHGGGGSDRSLLFRITQLVVIVFRSVTPLSYIHLILVLFFGLRAPHLGIREELFVFATFWTFLEVLFLPYYYFKFKKVTESLNSDLQHFASTPESRMALVHNCFQAMKEAAKPGSTMDTDPHKYLRQVIEGWFLDVPIIQIKHDNVANWCGWAFFGKNSNDLNEEETAQNKEIVEYIEDALQWKFPEGCNQEIMSARLTLDPVFATQRPFFFYATIWLVNSITHIILYALGFRKRTEFNSPGNSVYSRKACSGENDPSTKKPIVFVHGIGIGYAHYLSVVATMPSNVDVYLIEWPHVAMQMASKAPTIEATVDTFIRMLDVDQHDSACFVAHSLGSTAVSWMLHHPEGIRRVASTVLLDPVTFLLCDPKVATNFVYKDPTNTIDFLMHFFVSRELFIANALSRHFNWSHNIVFVEDLTNCSVLQRSIKNKNSESEKSSDGDEVNSNGVTKRIVRSSNNNSNNSNSSIASKGGNKVSSGGIDHSIFLSDKDSIVPVPLVTRYLNAKSKEGHNTFEVTTFEGYHGEMMLHRSYLSTISKTIRMRCGVL